jgi:hypothetical protein
VCVALNVPMKDVRAENRRRQFTAARTLIARRAVDGRIASLREVVFITFYRYRMQLQMAIDISHITFENWIDFIFDHPVDGFDVMTGIIEEEPWWCADAWQYSGESKSTISNLTRLFGATESCVSRFTREQVEQGFWFIPGPYGLMGSILDPTVSWAERLGCIDSIYDLSVHFFAKYNDGTAGYMWWDSVFSYCVFDGRNLGTELDVLEAVAEVIARTNRSGSSAAREIAQHGITHLLKLQRSINSPRVAQILKTLDTEL